MPRIRRRSNQEVAMRVLVSADMEGATGVTWPEDVRPGAPQWDTCRRLLTGDVNAVAEGYFAAGADDVLVNEAHASMRNLVLGELDPRARLLAGRHKPLGMMEGLRDGVDLVAFVGYHAGAGDTGVLSHTMLGLEITGVWLNGEPASEGRMNAALAAELGAKVVLVSGDDRACADAETYAPAAERVAVKQAVDRYSAILLPPARTAELLRGAAMASVGAPAHGQVATPPYTYEIEFLGTSSAAATIGVPGVERISPRRVRFTQERMDDAYRCFRALTVLGWAAREDRYG
jgi:D-amino peptidase